MLTLDVPALNICQRTEKTYLPAGREYGRAGAMMREPGIEAAVAFTVCAVESCRQAMTTAISASPTDPVTFEVFIEATVSSR